MKSTTKISIGLFLTLAVAGSSCSNSSSSGGQPTAPQQPASAGSTDVHVLYASDVAAFAKIDSNAVTTFDNENGQLFTKIFGGTNAASVQKYYSDRIHYAFSEDDLNSATITPDSFPYTGWSNYPQAAQSPTPSGDPSSDIQIGALNIGTALWLDGTLAGTPVTLTVGNQQIAIASSRTGVMMFGDGYVASEMTDSGESITLPPEYRQAILVHEARHSDCTGGLPEREIQIMRNAVTADDFLKQIPLPHCGHTHILCPSGTYQGIPACDAERYGAYKVGALYEEAFVDSQTDEVAREILEITALDYESRFISTGSDAPDELTPNMTSAGVTP